MRILGLDPGSRITGFGLVEAHEGRLEYIGSGCIRVRSSALPERLKEIFDGVEEIVDGYAPTVMAVERVFVHRNVDSALKLGHARGAALCAAVGAGLAIHEYTPAEIKQAIVGKGNATKVQVQHMVRALLQLPGTPQADAADALAAALCHAHTGSTLARMGVTAGRRRGRGRR